MAMQGNIEAVQQVPERVQPGVLERAKITVQDWYSQVDLSASRIIELVSCFGVAFFIGFLLKKYFRYVIIALLALIIGSLILNHVGAIQINWAKIQAFFGINTQDTIGSFSRNIVEWFKSHALIAITAVVGFILGYCLG